MEFVYALIMMIIYVAVGWTAEPDSISYSDTIIVGFLAMIYWKA